MKVQYLGPIPGVGKANIMWRRPFHPARGAFDNVWPKTHPCFGNPMLMVVEKAPPASDDPLGQFRSRGYCASCFPEGDGICLLSIPEGKTTPDAVRDIEECFGWEVEVKRA